MVRQLLICRQKRAYQCNSISFLFPFQSVCVNIKEPEGQQIIKAVRSNVNYRYELIKEKFQLYLFYNDYVTSYRAHSFGTDVCFTFIEA